MLETSTLISESDVILQRKLAFLRLGHGGRIVWQELVRMAVTWVVMCGLVAFFYWMLGNIGTF
jgi:hypothetical protein